MTSTTGKTTAQEAFEEDLEDNIQTLAHGLGYLDDWRDKEKAEGIIRYYDTYGTLSDKQRYALWKLWEEVLAAGASDMREHTSLPPSAKQTTQQVMQQSLPIPAITKIDGSVISASFITAAKTITTPSIEYLVSTGKLPGLRHHVAAVKLVYAGDKSRHPKSILVIGPSEDATPAVTIFAQILKGGTVIFGRLAIPRVELQHWLKQLIEVDVNKMTIK